MNPLIHNSGEEIKEGLDGALITYYQMREMASVKDPKAFPIQ